MCVCPRVCTLTLGFAPLLRPQPPDLSAAAFKSTERSAQSSRVVGAFTAIYLSSTRAFRVARQQHDRLKASDWGQTRFAGILQAQVVTNILSSHEMCLLIKLDVLLDGGEFVCFNSRQVDQFDILK